MNLNERLRNKIDSYFKYFSAKEIDLISNLFEQNINLRDWEINELGIINEKKSHQKNF